MWTDFHPISVGKMMLGQETFLPCTPFGVMKFLNTLELKLQVNMQLLLDVAIL